MKRIPVPESAVRSAEEILKGMTVIGNTVWATCWNCGGTGNYPSSMIPPGRCRLYCWKDRTPDTFGKLGQQLKGYVKKQQASDRANYRAQERAKIHDTEVAQRLTAVDPKITALASSFGLDVTNLPLPTEREWNQTYNPNQNRDLAVSLIQQWLGKGELTDKQWTLAASLPEREKERLERQAQREAVRQARTHIGSIGDRVELTGTVERVSSFLSKSFRGYGVDRRYIVRLLTTDGNVVSWFADYPPVKIDEDGKVVGSATVTLKGTVKKHEEYKGEKQTVLFRVKVA